MEAAKPTDTGGTDRPHDRVERVPLSLDRIQTCALRIVAEDGLAALTMRRLAAELGVWPTALYHHVADKAALIQLALDGALAELEVPDDRLPWQDWYRSFATNARNVALRYPGLAAHLEEHGNLSRESLAVTDRAIAVLLRAGFDPEHAAVLYSNVFTFIIARCRREALLERQPGNEDGPAPSDMFEQLGKHLDDLPALRAAAETWEQLPPSAYLTSGVELLLAGAQQQLKGHQR